MDLSSFGTPDTDLFAKAYARILRKLDEAKRLFLEDKDLKNRVLKNVVQDLESVRNPTVGDARKSAEHQLNDTFQSEVPPAFRQTKLNELEPSLDRLLIARKALEYLKQTKLGRSGHLKTVILFGSTSRGGAREEKEKIQVMFPFASKNGTRLFFAAKAVTGRKSDIDFLVVVSDDATSREIKAAKKGVERFLIGGGAWIFREKNVNAAISSDVHSIKLRRVILQPHIPLYGKTLVEDIERLSKRHATKIDAGLVKFYRLRWSYPIENLGASDIEKLKTRPAYTAGKVPVGEDGELVDFKFKFPRTWTGKKLAGFGYNLLLRREKLRGANAR